MGSSLICSFILCKFGYGFRKDILECESGKLRCFLVLILLLGLVGVFTGQAFAGSQEVTVTASGIVVQCPGGLVLDYVSDSQIQLSWVKAVGTNTSMVRGRFGQDVLSSSDGYLLYQGTDNVCMDDINVGTLYGTLYYRIYGIADDGEISVCYASGDTGRNTMHITGSWLLLSLIGLCLGLSYLSLKVDLVLFRLAPILGWIALAFMFFTNVFGTDIGDPWTTFVAFLFIVMAFAIMLLQMNSEVKHEAKGKGGKGYSWTS